MKSVILPMCVLAALIVCGSVRAEPNENSVSLDTLEKEIAQLRKENTALRELNQLRKENAALHRAGGNSPPASTEKAASIKEAPITIDSQLLPSSVRAVAILPGEVAPIQNWTGVYIGVQAGTGSQKITNNNSVLSPFGTAYGFDAAMAPVPQFLTQGQIPGNISANWRGFLGGVTLGYNRQSGPLVYGLELDVIGTKHTEQTSDFRGSVPGLFNTQITNTEMRTDWLTTLRARAGYLIMPQFLLYGTGGIAGGHVQGSTTTLAFNFCAIDPLCATGSGAATLWGWTVGGGGELELVPGLTVKLEYLYYDLGNLTYNINEISPTLPPPIVQPVMRVDAKVTGQIVRLGANLRF